MVETIKNKINDLWIVEKAKKKEELVAKNEENSNKILTEKK